jgi:hypothetical protein
VRASNLPKPRLNPTVNNNGEPPIARDFRWRYRDCRTCFSGSRDRHADVVDEDVGTNDRRLGITKRRPNSEYSATIEVGSACTTQLLDGIAERKSGAPFALPLAKGVTLLPVSSIPLLGGRAMVTAPTSTLAFDVDAPPPRFQLPDSSDTQANTDSSTETDTADNHEHASATAPAPRLRWLPPAPE